METTHRIEVETAKAATDALLVVLSDLLEQAADETADADAANRAELILALCHEAAALCVALTVMARRSR